MYSVSDEFIRAIQENTRQFYYSGTIIMKDGTMHSFSNEDIVKGSGYITNQCCGNNEIELGGVYAAEFGITLYSEIDRYSLDGALITLSFFLEIAHEVYEEIPMGIYEISEANRTLHCLAIKAYDYMLRFDKDFENTVISGTAFEFLSLACESCVVELSHTKEEIEAFDNGEIILGIYTENDISTWRDVIYYVSQVLGSFSTINREGKLELRKYNEESMMMISQKERFTSSFSDFITRYTGVRSSNTRTGKEEYYALEVDDGLTMNLGSNPLLQFGLSETRETLLTNILNDISKIRYVPFDSSTIGNPAFDLGDVITFSGGQADEGQITCITKYEYRINGKHSLKCVGKNPRLSESKSKTEKSLTGLTNSIEAGKISVYTYISASDYSIGEIKTEIASIAFASTTDTEAQFHASILLDVSSQGITRNVLLPGEEVQELSWEEDGKTILKVTYVINDAEITTFYPVESYASGKHILNLYYPLNGVEANTYHTFRVYVEASGGSVNVETGNMIATISGQGLSANAAWDGRLELEEERELIDVCKMIPLEDFLETKNIEKRLPVPKEIQTVMSQITLDNIALVQMVDNVGFELT